MVITKRLKQTDPGAFPVDWEVVQLGELFSFSNGVNAPKSSYGHGIPFVNVLECISHTHLTGDEVPGLVSLPKKTTDRFKLQFGDIVFNRTSETQEEVGLAAAYVGKRPVVFGGFVIRGRPVGVSLDPFYSGYALRSAVVRSQITPSGQGAVRANISQENLRRVAVPVPTLSEQAFIAEALRDVDSLIDSLERLIAKKRDSKQASMQQILTAKTRLPGFGAKWKHTQLASLGDTYSGLSGKSKADFERGTAKFVTFLNVITNVVIDPALCEQVSVGASENQNVIRKGDLLFNGSSETPEEVAFCSFVDQDYGDIYLNSFCFGFRPLTGSNINGYFMSYLIRSATGREVMKSLAQGSTRYNISKSSLKQASLELPTLEEQNAIVDVIRDMDHEIQGLHERLKKTREIRQGMMQQLLTGKVRLV